jgi:hypothetical protein
MAIINEDRLEQRLMSQFKGRVVLIAVACLAVGLVVGALLF